MKRILNWITNWLMDRVRQLLIQGMHLIVLWMGGMRIEGRENIPKTGGVLITPNHISDTDPLDVAIALPRLAHYMAKEELFELKFVGPFIRVMSAFPVKRYTADRKAIRRAEELLELGKPVVIFPEGKLSEDGELQEMLPGALMIAKHTNVPIVPTLIVGANLLLPYGETKPRKMPRPMLIRFGKPITVDSLLEGETGSRALHHGIERLREIILAMQQAELQERMGSPEKTLSSVEAQH